MCWSSSAGRLAIGSPPSSRTRLLISGIATAFLISEFSLSTISFGVFAGASTQCQPTTSKPGSVSATAGMSGRAGVRFRLDTAMARNVPPLCCGSADVMLSKANWMSPTIRALSISPLPVRYGTCVIAVWVVSLNSSPAMCWPVPIEVEPKEYLLGFFFNTSISSATFFTGSLVGLTIRSSGPVANSVIALKLLT